MVSVTCDLKWGGWHGCGYSHGMNATLPSPYIVTPQYGPRRNHHGRNRPQTGDMGRLILYALAFQALLIFAFSHAF